MSRAAFARRLDARVVPSLARRVGGILAAYRRLVAGSPVRLLRAAVSDTGLLGPGILIVLLAACLLAATGAT